MRDRFLFLVASVVFFLFSPIFAQLENAVWVDWQNTIYAQGEEEDGFVDLDHAVVGASNESNIVDWTNPPTNSVEIYLYHPPNWEGPYETSLYSHTLEPNPFMPMSIHVLSAMIDGVNLSANDEIAVFDGELCVGVGILESLFSPSNTSLAIFFIFFKLNV